MDNKEKLVRKIASKVRQKYALEIPADFEKIFKEKEIEYIEESLQTNGDGYSGLKKDQLKIVINSDIGYGPRKRFTIAHELGHIFIGWHDDVTICQTDNVYSMHNMLDIQEKEANIFASELLMPTDWVKEKISQYELQGLSVLIEQLCEIAQTSIMAACYALENAFSSGSAMIISSEKMIYPKYFKAEKTMEVRLRNMDFIKSCEELSTEQMHYSIGPYQIIYFKFLSCPKEETILELYNSNQRNLFETLNNLSQNNILCTLHCINSILRSLCDNYILLLYKNSELVLNVCSEGVETLISYDVSIVEIESFCIRNHYEYKRVDIEQNYEVILVKERVYKDPENWRNPKKNSRLLMNDILSDIYYGIELIKKRMSINGIIGAANGHRKINSSQQLYDLLYKKLNRSELYEFINHKDFEEFLSIKAYELINK